MKKLIILLFTIFLATNLFGQDVTRGRLNIANEDETVSTFPYKVFFPNVVDNGDGTTSVFKNGNATFGNLTVTGTFTGNISVLETDPLFSSKFANKTTDDLAQGSTNKYANTTKEDNGQTAYGWGNHINYTENLFNASYANATAKNPFDQVLNTTSNFTAAYYNGNGSLLTGIAAGANDTAYGPGWNGTTDQAPSQNAVYDKIESLSTGNPFNQVLNTTSNVTFNTVTSNITGNVSGNAGTVTNGVYTSRYVNTTAPLTGGGDLSANRAIAIPKATSGVDGYLNMTDWTTFDGKQNALGYTPYYPGGATVAVGDGGTGKSSWTQYLIPYANTTTSFNQIPIGDSGQVLTSNGAGSVASFQNATGGAQTPWTSNINGGGFNLTNVTNTSTVTLYVNGTEITGVALLQANATTDGYLDQGNFTIFNNKAPTASPTFTGNVTMPGTGIWNNTGGVGIGTLTPSSEYWGGRTLKISNNNDNSVLVLERTGTYPSKWDIGTGDALQLGIAYNATSLWFYILSTGVIAMPHYGAGAVTTDAGGTIIVTSDERLKNIQGNFTPGLPEVLKINPILYKWNNISGFDTNNTYAGFSAQNVMKYIPEAVGKDNQGFFTFNDRPVIAALVNAVRELQTEIDSLKAKNGVTITPYYVAPITDEKRIIKSKLVK